MVKEISVLNCNVRSKVPDRKQIEEENIFFGYLKNESCFPAIAEGPRGRFWLSKQRRCFSKQPQNSCILLSEQDLEVFLELGIQLLILSPQQDSADIFLSFCSRWKQSPVFRFFFNTKFPSFLLFLDFSKCWCNDSHFPDVKCKCRK